MSNSAFRNRKGKDLTKKMLIEKIEEMAHLMTYMEQTLCEWEIWYRLIPIQKKGGSSEEFEHFLNDGPVFNEMPSKIMESVREQVPNMTPATDEEIAEQEKPSILDAQGNVVNKTESRIITNESSSSNAKERKSSSEKILDIEDAMMGKETIIENQDEELETAKKSLSPFDFVKDIRCNKSGTILDDDENEKAWNSFMVLRILSMNDNDVDICNILNQYQGIIPRKTMYEALVNLINNDKTFYRYIKSGSKEFDVCAEFVSRYYEISKKEAQEYIDIMGQEWANGVKSLYENEIRRTK